MNLGVGFNTLIIHLLNAFLSFTTVWEYVTLLRGLFEKFVVEVMLSKYFFVFVNLMVGFSDELTRDYIMGVVCEEARITSLLPWFYKDIRDMVENKPLPSRTMVDVDCEVLCGI